MQNIIAKINNVSIVVFDQEKLVPIKPICEALGIDDKSQREKIKDDDTLSSVGVLSTSTGRDGKEYEMLCLPEKYILGWLLTINAKNVKPEAREGLLKYKNACYDVLYNHFSQHYQFVEERQKVIDELLTERDIVKNNFKDAKVRLKDHDDALLRARQMTFDDWKVKRIQAEFEFGVN